MPLSIHPSNHPLHWTCGFSLAQQKKKNNSIQALCPYAVFVFQHETSCECLALLEQYRSLSLSFFMVLMWFRYHSTSLLEMITKRVPSLLFCTNKSHTRGGDFTLVHKQEWTTCEIHKNKRHSRKPQHTYFFTQCQSWLVFAFIKSTSQARKKYACCLVKHHWSSVTYMWGSEATRTAESGHILLARILRESSECSSVNTWGFSQRAPTRPARVLEGKTHRYLHTTRVLSFSTRSWKI